MSSERVKLLLVDDQPQRLLSYEAVLAPLDVELVKASSGAEALQQLMLDDFAVILLDVSMPVMDGFETATLVRQHPRFEKTPIIFVTAFHLTDMDRLKGYELGAVDYVFVPVVPEILRSKVSVLVELFLKRRQLQTLNAHLQLVNEELAARNTTLQAERTRELERFNEMLSRSNAELEEANATLRAEAAVRERAEEALRASEDALRQADRRKDEFLAMLGHELRNPLMPILNAVRILQTKPRPDPEVAWCRDVILRQTEQLTRLVEDLLDVSRVTQGVIKLQREALDLRTVVAHAVEAMRLQIDAREHRLSLDLEPDPVWVLGDRTRLVQVLGNLLDNAAKYTSPGGEILVRLDRAGADARLTVQDNGRGMPPEMLPKLFEMFARGGDEDRPAGGLGVGLALVQKLVRIHGGDVAARSEGPGKGCEFEVRLPLSGASRRETFAPEPGTELAGRRILVIDDNADAATSLALLLRREGHTVATANDGPRGLELGATLHPELVLLDIGMPQMNGYEVARRLRDEPWGKQVLLAAVTGWGQAEVGERVREAGFDFHLIKPLDFRKLREILERLGTEAQPATT